MICLLFSCCVSNRQFNTEEHCDERYYLEGKRDDRSQLKLKRLSLYGNSYLKRDNESERRHLNFQSKISLVTYFMTFHISLMLQFLAKFSHRNMITWSSTRLHTFFFFFYHITGPIYKKKKNSEGCLYYWLSVQQPRGKDLNPPAR